MSPTATLRKYQPLLEIAFQTMNVVNHPLVKQKRTVEGLLKVA